MAAAVASVFPGLSEYVLEADGQTKVPAVTRQEYIDSRYEQHLSWWTNIAVGFGAFVSLTLIPMDIIVSPENGLRFSIYRIAMAVIFAGIFLLNRKKISEKFNSAMGVLAGTIAAIMIAAMIYSFNGHESVYFAGFIILMIFMVGIIPFRMGMSLFVAMLIYAIYLFPNLFYDDITNSSFFIAANVLMLSCTMSLLIMRYYNQKGLIREFGLSFDVSEQKAQLEDYSHNLEQQVGERTRELNESERMLRSLFQGAGVGIVISDKHETITIVNQLACEMLGYERGELIGADIGKIEKGSSDDMFQDRFKRILAGESLHYEALYRNRDGREIPVEVAASAVDIGGEIRVQSFLQDATEKKKLIAQLTQSQKMEAVGRLAGGVAHDFNNLLTTITGNCELALIDLPPDDSVRKQIDEIREAARRAASVTSQLLSFSRKQVMKMATVDINEVVESMGSMLARLISEEIELQVEIDTPVNRIRADYGRLEQILMNLAVNARDAMPFGGRLTISTGDIEVDETISAEYEGLVQGSFVLLTVSDSGEGIDQETLDKIFEPFFTTKEMGKGTGLGLATVMGIVKQHNGYIFVESDIGSGTRVKIFFPVISSGRSTTVGTRPDSGIREQRIAELGGAGPELRGTETIIVVDDEAAIRSVVIAALSYLGYHTLEANCGERALELCREHGGAIDVMLTDLIMPGMNGRELARVAHEEYPGMIPLFMSGYTEDIIEQHGMPGNGDEYIQKPISPIALAQKLRNVLNIN
jgi:PAS domain S-box-containing protein